jgi:ABC-type polysaccharide/polyol phosphate export permease
VLLGGALVGAYGILVIGGALDRQVVSFWPVGMRWWLVPAMLAGTLAWFLADEWATRGCGSARGAFAFSKLCFLVSLALAIALDPPRLFFLVIILPVILVLFLAYGLIGRWTWRATGHPFVAAIGNAAMLAWAIGTIFPLVARQGS